MLGNRNDNASVDSNNIVFTIKDTKLHVPVVTLSAKNNQKLSKLLSKGIESLVYWNDYKTQSENKNKTDSHRYFTESNCVGVNRLFVLIYPNQDSRVKRFNSKKYYLPKGNIGNDKVTVNGKNFRNQPSNSDIKQNWQVDKVKIKLQYVC